MLLTIVYVCILRIIWLVSAVLAPFEVLCDAVAKSYTHKRAALALGIFASLCSVDPRLTGGAQPPPTLLLANASRALKMLLKDSMCMYNSRWFWIAILCDALRIMLQAWYWLWPGLVGCFRDVCGVTPRRGERQCMQWRCCTTWTCDTPKRFVKAAAATILQCVSAFAARPYATPAAAVLVPLLFSLQMLLALEAPCSLLPQVDWSCFKQQPRSWLTLVCALLVFGLCISREFNISWRAQARWAVTEITNRCLGPDGHGAEQDGGGEPAVDRQISVVVAKNPLAITERQQRDDIYATATVTLTEWIHEGEEPLEEQITVRSEAEFKELLAAGHWVRHRTATNQHIKGIINWRDAVDASQLEDGSILRLFSVATLHDAIHRAWRGRAAEHTCNCGSTPTSVASTHPSPSPTMDQE